MSAREPVADLEALRALCVTISQDTIALRALRETMKAQRPELLAQIRAARERGSVEPVSPWPPEAFQQRRFGPQRRFRALRNQQRRALKRLERREAAEAAAREAAVRKESKR
jgi:hypothetical protein